MITQIRNKSSLFALIAGMGILTIALLGTVPLVYSAVFVDSFDVSADVTIPTGLTFNPDGTKMFVTAIEPGAGDDITEYNCASFDVSTCVVDAGIPLNVNAQDPDPTAIVFNPAGTKMFVLGNVGNEVNEYDCAAFDVSTCIAEIGGPFSIPQDNVVTGLAFNTDGTKMFVAGAATGAVYEYNCASFDVSTCVVDGGDPLNITPQETAVRSIAFSTDGERLFVAGITGDDVNEYSCTTGFDVSTCVYQGDSERFNIFAQVPNVKGIAFSADGLKLFVIGDPPADDSVFEYSLGTAFDVSSIPTGPFTAPATPSSTPSSLNSSS